ncbi:uncharacterized protein SCHCODRAFT_02455713, partial [Schizophyllum commune H4-8]|uniref:uncharacterized protein n=1 Tax=Schizophyllum commune (strain H4-8 / FGSC 9210) TaxID=578458 RepID=UPI00215E6079
MRRRCPCRCRCVLPSPSLATANTRSAARIQTNQLPARSPDQSLIPIIGPFISSVRRSLPAGH